MRIEAGVGHCVLLLQCCPQNMLQVPEQVTDVP